MSLDVCIDADDVCVYGGTQKLAMLRMLSWFCLVMQQMGEEHWYGK
jgi:hypothetical protein